MDAILLIIQKKGKEYLLIQILYLRFHSEQRWPDFVGLGGGIGVGKNGGFSAKILGGGIRGR